MSDGWPNLISKLLDTLATYTPRAADRRALRKAAGRFTTPANSATVSSAFICSGTATSPSPRISLWLAISVDGLFWPKTQVAVADDGTWSAPICEAGTSTCFAVVLLAVTSSSSAKFSRWLTDCQKTGSFPGLFLPSGTRQLASITVQLNP